MVRNYFHLHLVSDATGETLIAVSRAAAAQYQGISAIEHVYPLVRTAHQLDRVVSELEAAPGIVLYTLVEPELAQRLEEACVEFGCPCLSVLDPVLSLFQSYLGTVSTQRPGAQHVLNGEYFKRIDALNYTLLHDDGQMTQDLEFAEYRELPGVRARDVVGSGSCRGTAAGRRCYVIVPEAGVECIDFNAEACRKVKFHGGTHGVALRVGEELRRVSLDCLEGIGQRNASFHANRDGLALSGEGSE